MAKCIVMNIENPKNKTFEVCVNGERYVDPVTKQYYGKTDEEIELKEMFIHALENAVVNTMVPDTSVTVKQGEIYKIPFVQYRYRVIRLEKKAEPKLTTEPHNTRLEEGVSPKAVPIKKLRGNPKWRKVHVAEKPVEAETEHQLTEV